MTAESGSSSEDAAAAAAAAIPASSSKHDDEENDEEDENDYIKTTTANYISRVKVNIHGAKQVEIKGRTIIDPYVTLHGDLSFIRMGRYSRIGRATILSPPPLHDINNNNNQYVPMTIGNHTFIGPNCHIQAAAIGSYCYIGNNVTLGPRVIIKDACIICNDVIITADTVVPPFTRISCRIDDSYNHDNDNVSKNNNTTASADIISMELSPATVHIMQEESMEIYQEFVAKQKQRLVQM